MDAETYRAVCLQATTSDPESGAGTFVYALANAVPRDQQPTAVVLLGQNGTIDQSMTIGDICDKADRLAASYIGHGIKAKEVVAIHLDDTFAYFLHFVALTSLGATPALINGNLDPKIVHEYVRSIKARVLVVGSKDAATLTQLFVRDPGTTGVLHVSEVDRHDESLRPPLFVHQNDDVILLAHTSGTTGIPKAVMFTHESMFHGVHQQIARQKGDNILSALPHSHGAAISLLMLSLTRGAVVTIVDRKAPGQLLEAIERVGPDVVIAFPKTFVDLCRMDLDAYNLDTVQFWIATGDANHEAHIKKLIAQGHSIRNNTRVLGSTFIDNLGSSEFAFAAFRNIHYDGSTNYDRCIGRPFPWVETAIFDTNGHHLPAGHVGRLGVRSKSVTKGYWNNNNLSEVNRIDGFWLTGDLVFFDENGIFFHVDREGDSIETSMGALYTCQAEEWLLKRLPEIFEVSVVARSGIGGGRMVVALLEMRRDDLDLDLSALMSKINDAMDERGWPHINAVELQSAHAYTGATGKKLKRRLRNVVETQAA